MGRPPKGENAATERHYYRLTKAQSDRLKRFCANHGTNTGAVTRKAVEAFLDDQESK